MMREKIKNIKQVVSGRNKRKCVQNPINKNKSIQIGLSSGLIIHLYRWISIFFFAVRTLFTFNQFERVLNSQQQRLFHLKEYPFNECTSNKVNKCDTKNKQNARSLQFDGYRQHYNVYNVVYSAERKKEKREAILYDISEENKYLCWIQLKIFEEEVKKKNCNINLHALIRCSFFVFIFIVAPSESC